MLLEKSGGSYGHESEQTPGDSGGQRSLACYSPGDLPDPGIEHTSLKSTCIGKWVSFLPLVPPGKPFFCLERQNGSYPLGIPTAGCVFHSIVAVVQSCSSLCNPVYCSRPGSSVLHYLLEFAQIHVH